MRDLTRPNGHAGVHTLPHPTVLCYKTKVSNGVYVGGVVGGVFWLYSVWNGGMCLATLAAPYPWSSLSELVSDRYFGIWIQRQRLSTQTLQAFHQRDVKTKRLKDKKRVPYIVVSGQFRTLAMFCCTSNKKWWWCCCCNNDDDDIAYDADAATPSSNIRSYKHQSVPSSLGRSFLVG